MSEDLCGRSALELRTAIASGALSPVELVDAVLTRIERLQPLLNCFITVCTDAARSAAHDSAERLAAGAPPRALEGIPFTAKDLVNTAGVRTTFGSLLHAEDVPDTDAVAIARLKAAGAILVGKTTTPEFGHKAFTDAPLFGRTRNAWHAERGAGGSSGGAAVAVAAGLAPLGVATDGGGSTRIPAACNGTVGIKPSAGTVAHSQTPDPFGNYTYVTPMTRTVADTALMLDVMSGVHWSDPWSHAPAQDFSEVHAPSDGPSDGRLDGLRVGVVERLGNDLVTASVGAALARSAAALEAAGATVSPFTPEIDPVEGLWRVINHSTWRARFAHLVAAHRERLTPTLVAQVEMAEAFDAAEFQRASFARGALFRTVQRWFQRFDVLLMPTLSRAALPIESNLFDPVIIDGRTLPEVRAAWFPYTMPFNLTGHPAVSVPAGFDADGLPLAVQLVGRLHEDAGLLVVAAALERAAGGPAPIAEP